MELFIWFWKGLFYALKFRFRFVGLRVRWNVVPLGTEPQNITTGEKI